MQKKRKPRIANTISSRYKLLASLMDSVPDVIYFKDRKGRLLLVNKAHANGLKLSPEEVIGKTDFDFFSKERARAMARDDQYVIKTGRPIIDKIERATRPDGVDNYVSTTKIPRFDEKGKVVGLIGITRDITKRMRFEHIRQKNQELEKKLKGLEELNSLKGKFISVVSHELRIPLAVVKEAVLLVLDGITGDINQRQRSVLVKARDNTDRLKKMIDDLLDMSRIESGKMKLRFILTSLNRLITDSSDFFKKLAEEKGVELEYTLPSEDVNIFIDSERINQVIFNLINNAIKFTEQGGKIRFELKVLESKVRIGIIDTGIGIAKQDISNLFGRFVQVSRVHSMERKGLGLGLSISKEIVERHQGEIWVESKIGVGSKFYFTLPRFYTVHVTDQNIRQKINALLNKDINAHLIHLVVINYDKFKARFILDPKKMLEDFKVIVQDILREFFKDHRDSSFMFMKGLRRGDCSIVLAGKTDKDAEAFCQALRSTINAYLSKYKVEDVFIALGIMYYGDRSQLKPDSPIMSNLSVKEIYIGSEARRFKRVGFKAPVEITGKNIHECSETIDISERGLCFICNRQIETDSMVEVRFGLPRAKSQMDFKSRVAWIGKAFPDKPQERQYKVGVEFVSIKPADKKSLYAFIRKNS